MAEHIDLGGDLAGYDDDGGGGAEADPQDYGVPRWRIPRRPGSGVRIPLAQLQAEGFNTTPPPGYGFADKMPYPGPRAVADYNEAIHRMLTWPEPHLPPTIRVWLSDDPSNGSAKDS